MARPALVVVRLKLRLLRRGMEAAGIRGKVAFAFAYLLAIATGLLGAFLFSLARVVDPAVAGDIAYVVFAALFFFWVTGPLLMAAVENTLEVDRLALFPLSARQLMPGLLLASLVGFGGLTTALVLLGGIAGTAPASGLALLTVVGFALQLALCIAGSRVASTWLSALARKRRWRDVALTIGPLLGVMMSFSGQLIGGDGTGEPGSGMEVERLPSGVREVLRLLPSGPAATTVAAAREGRALDALVGVAAGCVVLAALGWLWWRGVQRVLTTAPESGAPRARRAQGQGRRPALYPRLAWWLPPARWGAVAAKELRMLGRDPRQRTALISAAIVAVFPLIMVRSAGAPPGFMVPMAALPALLFGGTAINSFGFDGTRFWLHVSAGDDTRSDLLGKNAALTAATALVVVVDSVILGAASGSWALVPATWGLGAVALGILLGLGNVLSIANPVPMPDSATNIWAQNTSQGVAATGPALLAMFGTFIGVGPFIAATFLLRDSVAGTLVLLAVEAAVGLAAWRVGLNAAVRRLPLQVDLLAKLDARQSA